MSKRDVRHLTGRGSFVDDIALPNILRCVFVRSSYPHAFVRGLKTPQNTSEAKIFTWSMLSKIVRPFYLSFPFEGCRNLEVSPLANQRVRYVGEPVAAVVAEDLYVAQDAANSVEVEYEPLPRVSDMFSYGDTLYDGWDNNTMVKFSRKYGDPFGEMERAEVVVEERIATHRVCPAPMETRGVVASYDAGRGFLTVWSPNQNPHMHRTVLSEVLNLPESRIRVISPDIGGGFGQKGHTYAEDVVVAALSILTGRPVKWIEERRENFMAAAQSREQVHLVKIGADKNGRIKSLIDEAYLDLGAYPLIPHSYLELAHVVIDMLPGPYRIENYAAEISLVVTNKTPAGAYRGFGHPEATFVRERALDILAEEIGLDPVTIRKRNLISASDIPYMAATGMIFDSGRPLETFETLVQQAGHHDGGDCEVVGVGYAVGVKGSVPTMSGVSQRWGSSEAAMVRLSMDGKPVVFSGAVSMGTRLDKLLAKIVSEILSVSEEDVEVVLGDTLSTPFSTGLWGSRGAVMVGGAVAKASTILRRKIQHISSILFECRPEDVILENGKVFVKDAVENGLTLSELAWKVYNNPNMFPQDMDLSLMAEAVYDPPNIWQTPDELGRMNATAAVSTIACAAFVTLDVETFEVKVKKLVLAENGGTYLSPKDVDEQLIGGAIQAYGASLFEEIVYSNEAIPLTTTFSEYLLPTAVETPSVEVIHLVDPSPYTFRGAKGVGETATIPVNAAIANAIQNALKKKGIDVKIDLSITSPSRLWSMVRK
ncbi:MAG: xanthine dehydrogenase family protein molybdopterin-binding subunit [Candidatus Caldarchaeum sp.]|jgi:carbon-monoxide dehydrogenase large subunit|nr:xanthine dehydrogenase family protein molybdopterin-binding subunit [Candidatus Caldarchaeales archaeon]